MTKQQTIGEAWQQLRDARCNLVALCSAVTFVQSCFSQDDESWTRGDEHVSRVANGLDDLVTELARKLVVAADRHKVAQEAHCAEWRAKAEAQKEVAE